MSIYGKAGAVWEKMFSGKNLSYAKSLANRNMGNIRSIGRYAALGAAAGGIYGMYSARGNNDQNMAGRMASGALKGGALFGGLRASKMVYNRFRPGFQDPRRKGSIPGAMY